LRKGGEAYSTREDGRMSVKFNETRKFLEKHTEEVWL
jgi:hypothetical protein